MNQLQSSAIVSFSGGQDSTTCLYWAKARFEKVYAVGFDYGQKHRIELDQARKISKRANVPFELIDLKGVLSHSSLVDASLDISGSHPINPNLPSSFTPGRNALFLNIVAARAFSMRIQDIVIGVCQTDQSGYPDCRPEFIASIQSSLSLAMNQEFRIHTPLMNLSKAEIWKLGSDLGCLDIIVEETHTDYNGDRSVRNEWGYGKLDNPATILRAKGFEEAKAKGWIQ